LPSRRGESIPRGLSTVGVRVANGGRLFEVKFPKKSVQIWERDMPDGKIEQFQVMAKD